MWLEITIALLFAAIIFSVLAAATKSVMWLLYGAACFFILGLLIYGVGIEKTTGYTWVENRPIDPGSSDLNRTDMNILYTVYGGGGTDNTDFGLANMAMVCVVIGLFELILAPVLQFRNMLKGQEDA